GRALALDPSSPQALQVTARLMLEPPAEVPDEVRHDIEAAAITALQQRAAVAAGVYGFFVVLLLAFPWLLGVRGWTGYAGILATTAVTSGVALFWWLHPVSFARRRFAILSVTACGFIAIAAASWLTTPLVLGPAFVIGLITTTMADGLRENVLHYVAMGLVS